VGGEGEQENTDSFILTFNDNNRFPARSFFNARQAANFHKFHARFSPFWRCYVVSKGPHTNREKGAKWCNHSGRCCGMKVLVEGRTRNFKFLSTTAISSFFLFLFSANCKFYSATIQFNLESARRKPISSHIVSIETFQRLMRKFEQNLLINLFSFHSHFAISMFCYFLNSHFPNCPRISLACFMAHSSVVPVRFVTFKCFFRSGHLIELVINL
jgi:hypothetical protein